MHFRAPIQRCKNYNAPSESTQVDRKRDLSDRKQQEKRMHRLPNAGFLVYKGITRNILCEIYRGALAYPQGAVRAKGPTKSATEERQHHSAHQAHVCAEKAPSAMLVVPTETQIECYLPNDGYTQDIKDVET